MHDLRAEEIIKRWDLAAELLASYCSRYGDIRFVPFFGIANVVNKPRQPDKKSLTIPITCAVRILSFLPESDAFRT